MKTEIEVKLQEIRGETAAGGNICKRVYNALKSILDYITSIDDDVKVVLASGETFFGEDDFRKLNHVRSYESDTNSIGISAFSFKPVSAKPNAITTVANFLFKGSNFTYGSFNAATSIDNAAFAQTQLYYVNKQGATTEYNIIMPNI